MIEYQPGAYKFRDYLASIFEWTQENENKNPIHYYFPITSLDLAKYNEVVKWGYKKDIPVIELLWEIMERKKYERTN